jgi:hypothetical protein
MTKRVKSKSEQLPAYHVFSALDAVFFFYMNCPLRRFVLYIEAASVSLGIALQKVGSRVELLLAM